MTWYYYHGVFYPENERVTDSKIFQTLPTHNSLRMTYQDVFKQKIVPISMLSAFLQDKQFNWSIKPPIGVYDIETDRTGKIFKLGVINNDVYYNSKEMVDDLLTYNTRIGHNIFRFDNEVLYNYSTKFLSYNLNKFIMHFLPEGLNLDLMFFARILGFSDLSLRGIARILNLTPEPFEKFNEEKCLEDVKLVTEIINQIKIHDVCKVLNQVINVDIHFAQNCFFDKLLRYILLTEYLKQGYLPLRYPNLRDTPKLNPLLKIGEKKEYKDKIFYYDVENAYMNTATKQDYGIYEGEKIFTDLHKHLLTLLRVYPSVKPFFKKVGNALIGYMHDQKNYFRNDSIWYNIVTNFNNIMLKNIPENIIWANLDGFMTLNPYEKQIEGYNIRVKDLFRWLYVFNPNKYIAITNLNEVKMIGFRKTKIKALELAYEDFKDIVLEKMNVIETLKTLKISQKDENWKIKIRKVSNTVSNLDYLDIWEDLPEGFHDYIVKNERREDYINSWRRQFV